MIHSKIKDSHNGSFSSQSKALQVQELVESFKTFNESNFVRLTRHLHRQVTNNMNKRLEACGYDDISTRHLSIFDNLDFGGTNIVTLANRANITKQAMGKLVKEATASGYIATTPDKTDFRSTIVDFTEKGLIFVKNVQRETTKAHDFIAKTAFVPQNDIMTTIETMSRILNYFDNSHVQKELSL